MNHPIFYRSRKKKNRKFWRPLFKFFLWLFVAGVIFFTGAFAYYAKDLPNLNQLNERRITESTKIFDRTGKVLLYDIHGEEKRTVVASDQIPDYAKWAAVVAEDANFYRHSGLDFKGILRAALYNLLGRKISQGGSTITQQFIKKAVLSDERTWSRKIKEAVLALEIERRYSKDEILTLYLNQVPYGSSAYGLEAAAQTFFGKPAKDLTLAESATLAALPQAPSRLSPYGSHPEDLKTRQEYILNRMAKNGFISQEETDSAKKDPLSFSTSTRGIKAPHFVMYIKEYLENNYSQEAIETQGLKVYTTLDWDLQEAAEKIISAGAKNNAKKYNAANAALAAIDPKTGQILAMVGSADYFDTANDGNVNVTIRDRQPGSSFKPFAYVTAFAKGFTPDTVLFDVPTEFNPNCSADATQEKDQYGLDCYHPGNYDEKIRGPVTARQALAQSLNIPSVEILYLAGIEDTIKTAKNMGITSLNGNYYGLSLVLGGGEVKLLDEVAAYGVFANEGVKNTKTSILKIEDAAGKILEEYKPQPTEALTRQNSRLITDILSDNAARAPVFGAASALYFPERPVAAKTGTTQKYRDAWTLGYTPSLAVGVWVGNNDNTSMSRAGAGLAAAGPLWHEFIKRAYELKTDCDAPPLNAFCLPKEVEAFTKPDPIATAKSMLNGSYLTTRTAQIDKISGGIATPLTPPDLIMEKTLTGTHSILHYIQRENPQGEAPQDPAADEQYRNWEAAAQAWLTAQGLGVAEQLAPGQTDSLHTPENIPQVKIIYPVPNQTISQALITAQTNIIAPLGVKQVDFFINDQFIGSTMSPPYQLNALIPPSIPNGQNTLIVRVYDQASNRQEEKITIYINR